MEILKERSALLSNYEVLKFLKEIDTEQNAQVDAIPQPLKELPYTFQGIPENASTVQTETINWLQDPGLPTIRQNSKHIMNLLKGLAPYGLTKAEKLQIVNLMPAELVELYVIVEDCDTRFMANDGAQMEEILQLVRECLIEVEEQAAPGVGDESMMLDGDGGDDDAEGYNEDKPDDDEGWIDQDAAELMDGPRYGEYEDDLNDNDGGDD